MIRVFFDGSEIAGRYIMRLNQNVQPYQREFTVGTTICRRFEIDIRNGGYSAVPEEVILYEDNEETDQNSWDELIKSVGDDLDALKGLELTNQDNIRMVPDILQNEEGYFFPVFSSAEEMGEYGESFSKVEVHFLEAVSFAEHNEKDVLGIVLNPFTKQFVVNKDMFDVMKKMKSRIVEDSIQE